MKRLVALLTALASLLLLVAACSFLQSSPVTDAAHSVETGPLGMQEAAFRNLRMEERVSLSVVQSSPLYEAIMSSAILPLPPIIRFLPYGVCAIVMTLDRPKKPANETDMGIYPYVVFLVDSMNRQVVNAYRVTPLLSDRTLHMESLADGDSWIEPMSACVADGLTQTRSSSAAMRGQDHRVGLKRPCDESISQPVTECWCNEWIPAYWDDTCMSNCTSMCGSFPPLARPACVAVCIGGCLVPAQCAPGQTDCETIYPCDW